MASLRRSKSFNPDAHTKFLYAIIKQLDLRAIDWQDVANEIGIQNGHAARMRYSRLKSQFEGPSVKQKGQKVKEGRMAKTKPPKPGLELHMRDPEDDDDSDDALPVKKEMMGFDISIRPDREIVKVEDGNDAIAPFIKAEPTIHPMYDGPGVHHQGSTASSPAYLKPDPSSTTPMLSAVPPHQYPRHTYPATPTYNPYSNFSNPYTYPSAATATATSTITGTMHPSDMHHAPFQHRTPIPTAVLSRSAAPTPTPTSTYQFPDLVPVPTIKSEQADEQMFTD